MKRYRYVIGSILLLAICATLLESSFLSINNIMNILRQAGLLLCLSIGLTGVVLTGNIDLSVGAVAALSGCICAKMMVSGWPIPAAILLALLLGLASGMVTGILVSYLDLPSFVSTYGMNMVISGLALMLMKGGIIYDLPSSFTFLGIGYVGIIPVSVLIALAILLIFCFVYDGTVFGRNIYMIGHNKMASFYNGVNQHLHLVGVYLLSGISASIGGVIMTARLNAADAGMCDAYGLQIIAAVVVGGTSLLGGEGGVLGTFLGSIILTLIINIMNMVGIASAWQNFVLGLLIIIMVFLHRLSRRGKDM